MLADVIDDEGKLLADELGPSAVYVHLDVTDEQDWVDALATAEHTFGTVDVLVNNAGILRYGPLLSSQVEFEEVLAVNLVGPFLGIKVVGAAMAAAGSGSIVNVSSTGGMVGYSAIGAYVASKWGVRGLTKTAAIELGHAGVRVNSLHPGGVRTPMTDPDGSGAATSRRCSPASRSRGSGGPRRSRTWRCSSPATSRRTARARSSSPTAAASPDRC